MCGWMTSQSFFKADEHMLISPGWLKDFPDLPGHPRLDGAELPGRDEDHYGRVQGNPAKGQVGPSCNSRHSKRRFVSKHKKR